MAELKKICEPPESIARLFKDAITKELQLLADGIRKTEEKLSNFESKYQFYFNLRFFKQV